MSSNWFVNLPVTIVTDASLSNAINLSGYLLVGLVMPDTWTAAGITFSASADDTTYNDLVSATGAEVALTVAVDTHVALDPKNFAGVEFIKVRSGTSATPVVQLLADRELILVVRPA